MFTKVLMEVGAGKAPTYLLEKHLFLKISCQNFPLCAAIFFNLDYFLLKSAELSPAPHLPSP